MWNVEVDLQEHNDTCNLHFLWLTKGHNYKLGGFLPPGLLSGAGLNIRAKKKMSPKENTDASAKLKHAVSYSQGLRFTFLQK